MALEASLEAKLTPSIKAKTPDELLALTQRKRGHLKKYKPGEPHVAPIKIELGVIQKRTAELIEMATATPSLPDLNRQIAEKQAQINSLGKTASDEFQRKTLQVELTLLEEARERVKFKAWADTKPPEYLTGSLAYRTRLLKESRSKGVDETAIVREMKLIRQRQAELAQLNEAPPDQLQPLIARREEQLTRLKPEDNQARDKLDVELAILRRRATTQPKAVAPPPPSRPKEVAQPAKRGAAPEDTLPHRVLERAKTIVHPRRDVLGNSSDRELPPVRSHQDLAVRISVEYAFRYGDTQVIIDALASPLDQDQGTRDALSALAKLAGRPNLREQPRLALLKKVTQLAEETGKLRPPISDSLARQWRQAEIEFMGLLRDSAQTHPDWHRQTINLIDPQDVQVVNSLDDPSQPKEFTVRRSTGLKTGNRVEVNAQALAGFRSLPDNEDNLIVAGQDYEMGYLWRALRGREAFKPMVYPDGRVTVPLVKKLGRKTVIHLAVMNQGQYQVLENKLQQEAPLMLTIEDAAASDVGIDRRELNDEDSFFCMSVGSPAVFRLAYVEGAELAHQEALREYNQAWRDPRLSRDKAHLQSLQINVDYWKNRAQLAKGDQGHVRRFGEQLLKARVEGVYLVADGSGGSAAGDFASHLAVAKTLQDLAKVKDWHTLSPQDIVSALKQAVVAADDLIRNTERKPMYTTLTMGFVVKGTLYTVNVGDSRTYLFDEAAQKLRQLTHDHSVVQALIDTGNIGEDQRYTHPGRNVISRAVGDRNTPPLTVKQVDVKNHARIRGKVKLLVCCDGLWELQRDHEMAQVLKQGTPATNVQQLIDRANTAGGPDNITAVEAEIEAREP